MNLAYPLRRPRLHTLAIIAASVGLLGATSACSTFSSSNRDPRYATNTVADCVHGATGSAANLECGRNKMSQATNDISERTTDTGYANGNVLARNEAPYELSPAAGRAYSPPPSRY